MLVNVKLKQYDEAYWARVREHIGNKPDMVAAYEHLKKARTNRSTIKPTITGIYEDAGSNFEHEMEERLNFDDSYPVLGQTYEFCGKLVGSLSSYGVADNLEQILEQYAIDLENPNRKFCVALEVVKKDEQPEDGGWRWHKWGPYIGNHKIQCEYLYDEVGIEQVLLYHIYEIPKHLVAE